MARLERRRERLTPRLALKRTSSNGSLRPTRSGRRIANESADYKSHPDWNAAHMQETWLGERLALLKLQSPPAAFQRVDGLLKSFVQDTVFAGADRSLTLVQSRGLGLLASSGLKRTPRSTQFGLRPTSISATRFSASGRVHAVVVASGSPLSTKLNQKWSLGFRGFNDFRVERRGAGLNSYAHWEANVPLQRRGITIERAASGKGRCKARCICPSNRRATGPTRPGPSE